MAKAKGKAAGSQDLVEQILGQMIFATGSGSGGQWVAMEAIAEIRAYFTPFVLRVIGHQSIGKGTEQWKREAAYILHYMDTIGRVAAHRSIAAGLYWIDAAIMLEAIELVVAEVNKRSPTLGKWCGA